MGRVEIRRGRDDDWPEVWPILREVAATGDTYEYLPDISEQEAHRSWQPLPAGDPSRHEKWAAVVDGRILGWYGLQPNRRGLGDHVANAGYMVASAARGRGLGRALAEHSLDRARALGFQAMQFNAVVATNTAAVRLWRALGFIIVGTVPDAFSHQR
jgi:L-amino acid N-acyltransferase YncA